MLEMVIGAVIFAVGVILGAAIHASASSKEN